MMFRVLFVCTGNTCRSPMAEAILADMNIPLVEVKSAGIFAANGMEASKYAKDVLKENNICHHHLSNLLTKESVEWATHILAMTLSHKESILSMFPQAREKTFTLKEFAGKDGNLDIQDPFGGSLEEYRKTYFEIKDSIERMADKFRIIETNQEARHGNKEEV